MAAAPFGSGVRNGTGRCLQHERPRPRLGREAGRELGWENVVQSVEARVVLGSARHRGRASITAASGGGRQVAFADGRLVRELVRSLGLSSGGGFAASNIDALAAPLRRAAELSLALPDPAAAASSSSSTSGTAGGRSSANARDRPSRSGPRTGFSHRRRCRRNGPRSSRSALVPGANHRQGAQSARRGVLASRGYLPMQKRPKISPSSSSGCIGPVISPKASWARRRSSAASSPRPWTSAWLRAASRC